MPLLTASTLRYYRRHFSRKGTRTVSVMTTLPTRSGIPYRLVRIPYTMVTIIIVVCLGYTFSYLYGLVSYDKGLTGTVH